MDRRAREQFDDGWQAPPRDEPWQASARDEPWPASPRQARPRRASPGRPYLDEDDGRSRGGLHLGPIRLTPTLVVLLIALVGSLAYIAFALTVRDASQIPMLASGAAILGIVFVGLAISGAMKTYEAGMDGHGGRAFGLALGGGIAAIIGFLCFALAVVAALVYQQ